MVRGKFLEYLKTATLRYNAVPLKPLRGEMLESSEKKLIIIVGRLEKFKIQDMTPSLLYCSRFSIVQLQRQGRYIERR